MNNLRYVMLPVLFLALLAFHACDDEDEGVRIPSERFILSFKFEAFDPPAVGNINNDEGIVNVVVPMDADRSGLVPTIEISEGAVIEPESGIPQDFTNFQIYTVTGEDGSKKVYTVLVALGETDNASIATFDFPDLFLSGAVDNETNTISFTVPFGTDRSSISPTIVLEEPGASIEPPSGASMDFSQPASYVVTAPNGNQTTYTVTVEVGAQETGVRGVWITNVDSDVLNSQQKIQEAVDRCAELNVNTIFMVTYNKSMTMYPSDVMEDLLGVRIDPLYGSRDPLREMIDAAHEKGIKVFAWFEYGFAASFGANGGPIIAEKPHWAAIDVNGNVVVKNGFYWLNSLLPEVQDFMMDLVLEVVEKYPDLDGIQGDDRLPAMPSEGGYDDWTVAQYQAAHGGQSPPSDRLNSAWLAWRANILNQWGKDLYDNAKAINPNCIVAMSPSPLDFGYREYLQDYTTWVNEGFCDIVSPQVYRRENQGISVYNGLLNTQINLTGEANKDKFFPGILSYLSGYTPSEEFLARMIQENRKRGITGEVHFFYPILIVREKVFKAVYPGEAIFPEF